MSQLRAVGTPTALPLLPPPPLVAIRDLVVELGTSDLIAFDQVLRRIRLIPGVTNSETSLLLATPRSVKARL